MDLFDVRLAEPTEERYRGRGMAYFEEGLVELVSVNDAEATARCAGTRLFKRDDRLLGEGTCPAFADFGPWEHVAAVAYTVVADRTRGTRRARSTRTRRAPPRAARPRTRWSCSSCR